MIKIPFLIYLIAFTFSCSAASTYYSHYNDYLQFHWKSALTSTSILFKIFPYLNTIGTLNTFVVVYTKPANVPVTVIPSTAITFTSEAYPVQSVTVTGLTPNTQYYYTFIFTQDTTIDSAAFIAFYSSVTEEFQFSTYAAPFTPYSFTFGAASCAETGSTSSVFQSILDENIHFFIHMGDLHYDDISTNNVDKFYGAYYSVFNSGPQKNLFQNTPIYYVWDDHDFGKNDAEGTSPSKPAATAAFLRFAPYNTLKNTLPDDETGVTPSMTPYLGYTADPDYGIFRSFIIGRCLFIMLDLRSYQDVVPGDILGDNQRTWLENQIRYAGNNVGIQQVFFISSVPWISTDSGAVWGDFHTTQEWIGTLVQQYITGNNKKAMLLAGDAHMVAFDDGRNNKWGGFPVVQAASMDRTPSCKGGPYSHGTNPDKGQYARIEVTDNGSGDLCVNVQLKKKGSMRIAYDTCYPQFYPASSDNECPSKFMIWLKTYPGAVYILAFGSLGVFAIISLTIFFCCRRRRLRRKAAALKKKEAEYAQAKQEDGQEMKELKDVKELSQARELEYIPPSQNSPHQD